MIKIVALFLVCLATISHGQAPPLLRNPFTTNANPEIIVTNTVRSFLQIISIPNGNNGLNDMLTNTPARSGQLGTSQNLNNSGGSGVVFLWAAFTNALGSNGWGAGINIPEWDGNGALWPFASPRHNNANPRIRVNGSPSFATLSNATDANLYFENYNPFGDSVMSFPSKTTNIAYNYFGSGTYNGVVGTNSDGIAIFEFDNFGLTIGSIHPEWIGGVTNQAGSGVIILGGSGSAWPFHISDNSTYNTFLGQYPYYTIDRRGVTNGTMPIVAGVPYRVGNTYEPTQANWLWSLVTDLRTGKTYITNGTLVATNFLSLSTNRGANILGGNYFSSAVNNLNGYSAFQLNAHDGAIGPIVTFDNSGSERFGVMSSPTQYPRLGYTTFFGVANFGGTSLGTNAGGVAGTNVFTIHERRAAFTNLASVEIMGANIGLSAHTISGVGNGNTNYTLLANYGRQYLGSSNVNISAVMGYAAGLLYQSSVIITNLSANTWGIGFSAVTNRWKFLGPNNQTNSPTVLTNGTALRLSLEIEGTNVLANWEHFAPGL